MAYSLFAHKYFAVLQVKLMDAYEYELPGLYSKTFKEYIRNVRELCSECLDNIRPHLESFNEFIFF